MQKKNNEILSIALATLSIFILISLIQFRSDYAMDDLLSMFNNEGNNKNVTNISAHSVRRLYQNVPITEDTIKTARINNPDFIFKYCRIDKIKLDRKAQLMKCYTNFFGELYKNVIKIMEIALTDEYLVKRITPNRIS